MVRLETDAEDSYLENDPDRLRFENETGITREKSRSKLRRGKISVYLHCPKTTRVGQRDLVTFELELPDKTSLKAQREVFCVEPYERKKTKGETNIPEPKIWTVRKGEDLWNKLGYDEKSIGEIRFDKKNDQDSMIVISLENVHLQSTIATKILDPPIITGVEDKYSAGMAYYMLLLEVQRITNKPKTTESKSNNEQDTEITEKHSGFSNTLDIVSQTVALLAMPSD